MIYLINRLFVLALIAVSGLAWAGCSNLKGDSKATGEKKAEKPAAKSNSGYPPAPRVIANTTLKALDGEDFSIGDFKGKVVLVNLWATWCAPCIQEMPHFNELQAKYGEDGFVMVGLNTDEETEDQVSRFVKEQKLNYKIGWATQEIAEEFVKISKLPGIPQSLLLNRNGEMTGMFRGGGGEVIEKMVESVDKLMAEK